MRRFDFGRAEEENEIGLVTGLAWTEVGGDLLQIESTLVPGKGQLILTGQLGNVMKESASAALSVVRSRAVGFGIDSDFLQKHDVHLHVPDGATPKDGPSAGAAMVTSLVSMLTKVPVRADVAMTGEITLRGRVTAIGGLKEKLLAALRGGIRTVIIPEENRKDLADIPANVTRDLQIVPVKYIEEVLDRRWSARWHRRRHARVRSVSRCAARPNRVEVRASSIDAHRPMARNPRRCWLSSLRGGRATGIKAALANE